MKHDFHRWSFFWGIGVWTQGFVLAKQELYCLSCASTPFHSGCFWDGVWLTICSGWPQTVIPLISVSQVARIIGMSHYCPASLVLFQQEKLLKHKGTFVFSLTDSLIEFSFIKHDQQSQLLLLYWFNQAMSAVLEEYDHKVWNCF
jgi:hypothetical protein